MGKCACILASGHHKGIQCSNQAKPGSTFCGIHKNCKNPISVSQIRENVERQSIERQRVERQERQRVERQEHQRVERQERQRVERQERQRVEHQERQRVERQRVEKQRQEHQSVNLEDAPTLSVIRFPIKKQEASLEEMDKFLSLSPNERINAQKEIYTWSFWKDVRDHTNIRWELDTWHEPFYNDTNYMLFGRDFYEYVVKLWTETWRADFEQAKWHRAPKDLWNEAKDIVYVQKIYIPDSAMIAFIGDIHSSFHSLLDVLEDLREGFVDDTLKLDRDRYLIFLGDLVDRGPYSLEILMLVYLLKIVNPQQVYIVNGNHEDLGTYERYGLKREAQNQLGIDMIPSLKYLPTAIYMKYRDHLYHLSHGAFDPDYAGDGLAPFLKSDTSHDTLLEYPMGESEGDMNQYKWGDFDMDATGYFKGRDGRDVFGTLAVRDYLQKFGLTCMITGHQDVVNIGLMTTPEISPEIEQLLIPSKVYSKWSGHGTLHELIVREIVTLQPGRDFMALVTSTATISKNLPFNCYLMMK